MDLGCLEKHNFSTTLLENSRKHQGVAWFFMNSHKAFLLDLFPDWPLSSHRSVFKVTATTELIVTISN